MLLPWLLVIEVAASLWGCFAQDGTEGPRHLRSWVRGLSKAEQRTYSQNGEDGIILAILQQVDVPRKFYVEFGTEDGTTRNTRLLQERHGWTGVLMDGGYRNASINLHKELITEQNILALFQRYWVPLQFGLLSVDIDSYDFWVLKRILEGGYRPAILVTEVNSQVAPGLYTVAPARATGRATLHPGTFEFGASPELFSALVEQHGYLTVYCESHGVNCFHVRRELLSARDAFSAPSTPRQRPRYGDPSSPVCWPSHPEPTPPWYELSPSGLSIVSTDARPARADDCIP